MFFHKSLLKDVKKWWDYNEDWCIVEKLKKRGGVIFCTKPSIVDHIGANSNINNYDKSADF